jgi:hypothetical protein
MQSSKGFSIWWLPSVTAIAGTAKDQIELAREVA